jgi:hypothetical protein
MIISTSTDGQPALKGSFETPSMVLDIRRRFNGEYGPNRMKIRKKA